MAGTSVTLYEELNRADENNLAQMLAKCSLGDMFTVQEYDSQTITASATVTPPGGCLLVQSIEVKTSGTANAVGMYLPGNSGSTILDPLNNTVVGVAQVSADGKTITFGHTVTRVVVRYIKQPATALTTQIQ